MGDYSKSQKEREEWLAKLAPGDKVGIPPRWGRVWRICTVVRLTDTQFVVDNGTRYKRSNGVALGRTDYQSIHPVTQDVLDANEANELCARLDRINAHRHEFSIGTLRALIAAYEASQEPSHA